MALADTFNRASNNKVLTVPDELLSGLPPTQFTVRRMPWEELIALDRQILNTIRKEEGLVGDVLTLERGWQWLTERCVSVTQGDETVGAGELPLENTPITWQRWLAQEMIEEHRDGQRVIREAKG